MSNNFKILMIGTDINSQGGISSVITLYKNFWPVNNLINLSSYSDNQDKKVFFYCIFLVKYIFILLTDKDISFVHIHTASRGSFLRKSIVFNIAKFFNKKVVLHIHGAEFLIFYEESPNFIKKIIANVLDKSNLILVLSEQWKNNISKISTNNNIRILFNPVIIKEHDYIASETVNVLFMGRLGKRKGVYDIIEAAKYIKNINVQINLYGDGNIKEFEKLVINNNLQKKIKVRGWISGSDKDKIFQDSNIYILPSYNEGLPISILEAMAVGLSVISTPVGGISEAVEDGINGFLIQPGDYKALAEKIDLLANNQELRKKMGQESYRLAKEKFDIKIVLKQLKDIYDDMLK